MHPEEEYLPAIPTPPREWPVGGFVRIGRDAWPGWSALYAAVDRPGDTMLVISPLELIFDAVELCCTPPVMGWVWIQRVTVVGSGHHFEVRPQSLVCASAELSRP